MAGDHFLHGVEVLELDGGVRPVRTVKSSVIGLVGTAPKGPVNVPTLITGSLTEAVKTFGAGVGTIPDALAAIFDQSGALVVVINVLDPATHTVAVAAAEYTFDTTTDTITLTDAYNSSVVVQDQTLTTTYTLTTDYTIDTDTGVITRVTTGAITSGQIVSVAYNKPDPTAIIDADIIGGVDAGTGDYTGQQAFLAAEPIAKVVPKILIAPGYSHNLAVTSDISGIVDRLKAVAIADGPNTNDADAITYRGNFGNKRLYIVDPWTKVYDTDTDTNIDAPASARVAGMIAKSDNERGFWWSPSNREMYGIVGTSRPIDFALWDNNSRANLLNENEVATIIQKDGYRLWGNRTCSSDPKWAFLSVVRTADIINESLLRAHMWAVDRNITKTYIEDVLAGVNAYLRTLKELGAILGGEAWADPELNTPTNIADGKVYFDFDFTPPYPAEHITFRSRLVNDYIEEVI